MNKSEFINAMASVSGMTKKDSEKAFTAFLDVMTTALVKREKVQFVGFGTFSVQPALVSLDRRSSDTVVYHRVSGEMAVFTAAQGLKDAINK